MGPRRNRAILPRLQRSEARPRLVTANVDAALRAIITVISSIPYPHPITPFHGPHTLAVPATWESHRVCLPRLCTCPFLPPRAPVPLLCIPKSSFCKTQLKVSFLQKPSRTALSSRQNSCSCLGSVPVCMRHRGVWGLSKDRGPKGWGTRAGGSLCAAVSLAPQSPSPA